MKNLFNKVAVFSDIHYGLRLDSEEHNQDCHKFILWFIEQVISQKCDMIISCGDWFHNRPRTENRTGHYSEKDIRLLSEIGIPIIWIIGNHDLYFRDTREIHG